LKPESFSNYPKKIGVDVARFGQDNSVIIRRQGPKTWKPLSYNKVDTMTLAGYILDEARDFGCRTIFVDGVGVGGGVVDRLRQFPELEVIDVQSGEAAVDSSRYINMRIELWDRMREWIYEAEPDLPA